VKLLTIAETQDRLRVSLPSVYKLLGNGELPSLAIGRRRFVREDDLEAFLTARVREGLR
jgi:excisionase family DNA binding protein